MNSKIFSKPTQNLSQPGCFLEYSTLNKNLTKDYIQSSLSSNLKRTVAHSTLSQTKEANTLNTNTSITKHPIHKRTISSTLKHSLLKSQSSSLLKFPYSNSLTNIYIKSKEQIELHKRKIEAQRNHKQFLELSHMKPYVKMNINSRNILRNKMIKSNSNKELPHYMLTTKITKTNKINLMNLIQEEHNEIHSRNDNSNNNVSNISVRKAFSQERFNMFLKHNDNMLKRRKMREIKRQIALDEINTCCSFAPQLNNNNNIKRKSLSKTINTNNDNSRSKSLIKKQYDKIMASYNFVPRTNNNMKHKHKLNNKIVKKDSNTNKQNTIQSFQLKYKEQQTKLQTNKKMRTINTRNCNYYNKQTNNHKNEITYNFEIEQHHKKLNNNKTISNNSSNNLFNTLYKLNVNNNLPGRINENIITYNNHNNNKTISHIIEGFI